MRLAQHPGFFHRAHNFILTTNMMLREMSSKTSTPAAIRHFLSLTIGLAPLTLKLKATSQLAGLTSFAFATKATNAAGHIAYTQLDYHLGTPVNTQDPNGIVAGSYFNDSLDRPTQIRRAVGTALQNQTTFAYDDTNRIITTSSDKDANNDNVLVSKVFYDPLGRTVEARQYEGGTNYIATQ